MAQGNIVLHIGSTFNSEGFKRLDAKIKGANKVIGKFGHSFGSVMNAAENVAREIDNASMSAHEFGGTLGKVAGAAMPLIQGFMSMGVWGILIGAIAAAVGWLKNLAKSEDAARLAARGLSREYMTIEYQAKRYQARLDAVKAAHAEMLAAMKEAAALANAKDAEDLASYERQFEYSMAVAENEGKQVAEIAKQAKLKREMAELEAKESRMRRNAKVSIDAVQSEPVAVEVEKPAPVKVTAEAPDPVGVKTVTPDPIKVAAEAPNPVEVKTVTPAPVKVAAEAPDPVEVTAKAPKPVKVAAEAPKPVEVETRIVTAQQASQKFEQEAAWRIDAVTKIANADIALAKAEADRAIAFERVEVEARTRALKMATEQYGSTSKAAQSAQRSLVAAQEKLANTIAKSAKAVDRSHADGERQIMAAYASAARQRALNAAALVEERRAEGKAALAAAREAGAEQIRAAEEAAKLAKYRFIGAETIRDKRLETHDAKTKRDEEVAQFTVDEKRTILAGAKSRAKNKYGQETRTPEVMKAETELATAERNLASITNRAAIEREKIAHETEITVRKAEMALASATTALATARNNAENNIKAVEIENNKALSAVKEQARLLQERADWTAQEVKTARRAQQQNERAVRENAALDARIAEAKSAAARWQEEMARVRARDGEGRQIDFNEFKRREKKRDKEIAVDERRGRKIDAQAEGERDRLQERIFDRRGHLRKSANKQDIARWQELNRFIEMRRGNNPAQNAVDALEKQKAQNVATIATNVANIQKALGNLGL